MPTYYHTAQEAQQRLAELEIHQIKSLETREIVALLDAILKENDPKYFALIRTLENRFMTALQEIEKGQENQIRDLETTIRKLRYELSQRNQQPGRTVSDLEAENRELRRKLGLAMAADLSDGRFDFFGMFKE